MSNPLIIKHQCKYLQFNFRSKINACFFFISVFYCHSYAQSIITIQLDSLFIKSQNAAIAEGRFDEAIDYIEKYYSLAADKNDENGIFRSLACMQAIYRQKGDYVKSFFYARNLLRISKKAGNSEWMAESYWGLAKLYSLVEEQALALKYYRLARSVLSPAIQKEWMRQGMMIRFNLEYAELFSQMKIFDSAWHYYMLENPVIGKTDPLFFTSTGEYYYLQGHFEQSIQQFQLAFERFRQRNELNEIMRVTLGLGKSSLAIDDLPSSLKYARSGLKMGLDRQENAFIRDCYYLLAGIYEKLNLPDSSNAYFRKYIIFKDFVLSEQLRGRIAASEYEQQIAAIEADKHRQEISLLQEEMWKKGLIAILILSTLLALAILRVYHLRQKNEGRKRIIAENALRIQSLESEKSHSEWLQQKTELEMKALRARMNPHFIFNCLNSINGFIIRNKPEDAADYLTKFARLIRKVLEYSGKPFISLDDELKCLRMYLDLEIIRFDTPFNYSIDIDGIDISSVNVPPLLLQPFVENAIWHGLHPMKNKEGIVSIRLRLENSTLFAEISDNGVGRKINDEKKKFGGAEKESMGIELSRQRAELAENEKLSVSAVVIEDLSDGNGNIAGTRVLLRIPVKYN